MTRRIDPKSLRQGMQVFSGEGRQLGAIERTDADSITVNGQQYEFSSVERLEGSKVYLTRQVGASTDAGRAPAAERVETAEGELRVEVREERLDVAKRQVQLGEVQVRKEVVTEQQTVPVELMREEVHVQQRDVADRPATEAEVANAFQEGTIRVPVRGEEAVVTKEAVVTGEVVINKERTTETQQVADTVRKEVVQVDESAVRAPAPPQTRAGAVPAPPARSAATPPLAAPRATPAAPPKPSTPQTVEVAEGMDVASSDGTVLGVVKEVRANDFLLDRSGQRDLYVPLGAVAKATGNQIMLNVTASGVDDMGWPNPSLF